MGQSAGSSQHLIQARGPAGSISCARRQIRINTCHKWKTNLDVVLVPSAGASLRVSLASGSTARVVLAPRIFGVQAIERARPNTTSDYKVKIKIKLLFHGDAANAYVVHNVSRAFPCRSCKRRWTRSSRLAFLASKKFYQRPNNRS